MGQGSRTTNFGNIGRRALVAALLATTAVAGGMAASTLAQAQAAYSVPAGPLNRALATFGSQSGTQISYEASIVRGKSTQGVSGATTREQAIAQLLQGTGLTFSFTDATSVVVSAPAAVGGNASADGSTVLETITVQGQGATTEGTGLYTASQTSVGTGLPISLKETPQSVSVITRQQLDDQKSDSVREVLENTVGVTSLRQGIGADLDQFLSRGFYISNYMIDGVPTSLSTTSSVGQNTAMYDRVEIIRGAAGLTTGMGTPAGTVNLIRKRPAAEKQFSVTTEGGSWSRYGGQVDLSGPLTQDGRVRARLIIDHKDQDSWVDRYHRKETLYYGITEFDVGDSTLLTLGFSHNTNENDSPMRTGVPLKFSEGTATNFSRSTNIAPDWNYWDNETTN